MKILGRLSWKTILEDYLVTACKSGTCWVRYIRLSIFRPIIFVLHDRAASRFKSSGRKIGFGNYYPAVKTGIGVGPLAKSGWDWFSRTALQSTVNERTLVFRTLL